MRIIYNKLLLCYYHWIVDKVSTQTFMIDLKHVLQTNGGFCIIYRLGAIGFIPEVLLVQRKENGKWELPGGQVDYDTDNPDDPFQSAAIRESFEEAGIELNAKEVECEMFLQQLKKHHEDWLVGTVGLYSYLIRSTQIVDPTFRSEETSAIKFVSIANINFDDKEIMLAARRMIAHFYVNYNGSVKRKWGGNLGNQITFDLLGHKITV